MPSCTTTTHSTAGATMDNDHSNDEEPNDVSLMETHEPADGAALPPNRRRKKEELEEGSSDEDELRGTKKPCHIREQNPVSVESSSDDRGMASTTPRTEADCDTEDTQKQKSRLYFPEGCTMTFQEKLLWAMKLGRAHRSFEVMLKTGNMRAYITVGSKEAVDHLTTQGYDGTILELPSSQEKFTKVIIFGFPIGADPEFVLDDPRFVSAKRHVVRGEEKNRIVAVIRGELEEGDSVRIDGLGYRRMAKYVEPPHICLNCSKWGHDSWSCMTDSRCRYCGNGHHSSKCADLIKSKVRVVPRCCNCGGNHNARSVLCPKRPRMNVPGRIDERAPPHHSTQQVVYVPAPPPGTNRWDKGRPGMTEETETTEVQPASLTQFPRLGESKIGAAATGHQDTATQETHHHSDIQTNSGDNSQLMQCILTLTKELANLKEEVRQLRDEKKTNEEVNGEIARPSVEESVAGSGASGSGSGNSVRPKQRKLKIKGVEKVLKVHDFMENGFGKVEGVLHKFGNNDEMKDKLFKSWLELYKHMSRFTQEIDGVISGNVDKAS